MLGQSEEYKKRKSRKGWRKIKYDRTIHLEYLFVTNNLDNASEILSAGDIEAACRAASYSNVKKEKDICLLLFCEMQEKGLIFARTNRSIFP